MKLLREGEDGAVQIIDAINLEKTLAIFPDAVEMVGEFPDEFFRSAWQLSSSSLVINLNKAKEFCHEKRRVKRDSLFAPYDKIIAAQIPNTDTVAIEQARQDIRVADALVQESINLATTTDELKTIIEKYEAL